MDSIVNYHYFGELGYWSISVRESTILFGYFICIIYALSMYYECL